jgi:putative transposase
VYLWVLGARKMPGKREPKAVIRAPSRVRLSSLSGQRARPKGSVNRRRTVTPLATLTARSRADYRHKASRRLVNDYAGFAMETLRVAGLMPTRFAQSFADVAPAGSDRVLRYKAEWAGRERCTVETFTRSSGVCRGCGLTGERLPLAVREWRCTGCGAVCGRVGARASTSRCECCGAPESWGKAIDPIQLACRAGVCLVGRSVVRPPVFAGAMGR